jgi:hypothetical protein
MGGHDERELSSVFQVLPQFALKARGIVSMRGWEMRWRILIMQSEGDEGGSAWSLKVAIKPVRALD